LFSIVTVSVMNRVMHRVMARRRTVMHHAVMHRPAVMHDMVGGMMIDLRHCGRRHQCTKSNQTGNQ
jgi:hypothetical protein